MSEQTLPSKFSLLVTGAELKKEVSGHTVILKCREQFNDNIMNVEIYFSDRK